MNRGFAFFNLRCLYCCERWSIESGDIWRNFLPFARFFFHSMKMGLIMFLTAGRAGTVKATCFQVLPQSVLWIDALALSCTSQFWHNCFVTNSLCFCIFPPFCSSWKCFTVFAMVPKSIARFHLHSSFTPLSASYLVPSVLFPVITSLSPLTHSSFPIDFSFVSQFFRLSISIFSYLSICLLSEPFDYRHCIFKHFLAPSLAAFDCSCICLFVHFSIHSQYSTRLHFSDLLPFSPSRLSLLYPFKFSNFYHSDSS